MIQLFNQFSFIIVVVVIGFALSFAVRRFTIHRTIKIGLLIGYIVLGVFIGLTLRYPESPDMVENVADVEAMISNDTPTFLMLYSNY